MLARTCILLIASFAMLAQPASAGGLKLKGLFKLSVEDEKRIGAKMLEDLRKDPGVFAPDSQDKRNRVVQDVGRKLLEMNKDALNGSEFEYQFFLIKDESVNAFASPGGYIYVTEGLMDVMGYDQSMVAAVMAHEMGHVMERHVAQGYEKAMQGAAGLSVLGVLLGKKNRDALTLLESVGGIVYLKFNRDQEEESDRHGVQIAYNAGYDPYGMMRSLQCLEAMYGNSGDVGEWMTDHPSTDDRVKRTEKIARETSGHEHGYWPIPAPKDKDHPLYEMYGKPAAKPEEVTRSTSPVRSTGGGSASNVRFKGDVSTVHMHDVWVVDNEDPASEDPEAEDPPAEDPGAGDPAPGDPPVLEPAQRED
ncbi:M48 family metalloprotease [bacterium]|nr:M48 family metalloprotease [bacterium]